MIERIVRRAAVPASSLAVWLATAGCNSTAPGGNGGDGDDNANVPCTNLTYTNFAAGFVTAYCTHCHSSELTGIDRQGSPVGVDYDTLAGIEAQLDRIRVRAVEEGSMPPQTAGAFPTADELDMLAEWIDCGAPE